VNYATTSLPVGLLSFSLKVDSKNPPKVNILMTKTPVKISQSPFHAGKYYHYLKIGAFQNRKKILKSAPNKILKYFVQ
jgi:hypothetical protein